MSIRTAVSDQEPQAPTLRVITTAPTPRMATIDYRNALAVGTAIHQEYERRLHAESKPDDESDWDDAGEEDESGIEVEGEDEEDAPGPGWINEPPQPPNNEKEERAISPFIVNATLD